ncbi:MAG: hypothetical protein WC025_03695 [Candidatus Magasanikbacteria bacterium]
MPQEEVVKKPTETAKKVENKKIDDTNTIVPEYVGSHFYGTDHPSTETAGSSTHQSLQELIEKNIKWSQVIYNQNKKIKRRLTMMVIGNYLRLLLIVAPIILGIIYFPDILAKLNEYFGQYLGGGSSSIFDLTKLLHGNSSSTSQIDLSQIQKLLQSSK